jgi:hypothetical protein
LNTFIEVAIHTLPLVQEASVQILKEIYPLEMGLLVQYIGVGLSI